MSYGVTPTGFVRKPLSVIVAEIEDLAIEVFGPEVIVTAQSPLGQFIGLTASIISDGWELAEEAYNSYDPDQAEGLRLESLALLRLIERQTGETDSALRQAITNAGIANVRDADFKRALLNVDGVTWAQTYSNESGATDENGMPNASVAAVAIGGNDEEIAIVARRFIVPGIRPYGNTQVETLIDGQCRTIEILRPVERRVRAQLTITKERDVNGCPAPSNATIAANFAAAFEGSTRRPNGEDLTTDLTRKILCALPSVTLSSVQFAFDDDVFSAAPLTLTFFEIASVAIADVEVIEA